MLRPEIRNGGGMLDMMTDPYRKRDGDCHCYGYLPEPLPDPHHCGVTLGCDHDGRGVE